MDILEKIKTTTDIEELREEALKHLKILYNAMNNSAYRAEIFEFILGNQDLSAEFEYFENPKVSIVIPVRDEFLMTASLLKAIKRYTQGIAYEVIIADDNSTDEIQYVEQLYPNVRRIVNDTGHAGFIYNVNNAIKHARGEYIFSMNNDMLPLENYLNELLNVIENDKSIGIAGAKTLKIDGTIDECGTRMDENGRVELLGENEDMDFNDETDKIECDYCSGCSILFRKDVFDKSGGFDVNLAPAYYDDSDFAFNLKYNLGLKSVCVPRAKLFHFKGMSYEPNDTKGEIIRKNRLYFHKKWGKYLKKIK